MFLNVFRLSFKTEDVCTRSRSRGDATEDTSRDSRDVLHSEHKHVTVIMNAMHREMCTRVENHISIKYDDDDAAPHVQDAHAMHLHI